MISLIRWVDFRHSFARSKSSLTAVSPGDYTTCRIGDSLLTYLVDNGPGLVAVAAEPEEALYPLSKFSGH